MPNFTFDMQNLLLITTLHLSMDNGKIKRLFQLFHLKDDFSKKTVVMTTSIMPLVYDSQYHNPKTISTRFYRNNDANVNLNMNRGQHMHWIKRFKFSSPDLHYKLEVIIPWHIIVSLLCHLVALSSVHYLRICGWRFDLVTD